MKKILAAFIFIGCSFSAMAQASLCEETLNQATDEFNAGHFYEIPAKLKSCIDKNDFTREQRVRAYLLLSQVYLIIDDPAAAEDSYLKLLTADPEYVATAEKDPIDVVYLSSKFTSTPIFTPHLGIGLNTSRYSDRTYNSPVSGSSEKHGLRIGVQLGGGIDWNINNNWSLGAEGLLATRGFKTTTNGIFGRDVLTSVERLTFVDVPVYLKYSTSKGRLRPYAYGGVAGNFLLSAKSKLTLDNKTQVGDATNVVTSEGQDVNLTFARKRFSKSVVVGGGIKYKIGKDFIFVDARLMVGLSNMSRNIYGGGSASHPLTDAETFYAYVSPTYLRLDNISISVGYIRPLYNPRKIKKAKVKSVLRIFDRKN